MARRSKKKSKRMDAAGESKGGQRSPKIVEHVNDSDDEEIDEDEAFNSEDERLYGHFFEKKGAPSKQKGSTIGDDGDDNDEDEITSDEDGDSDADDNEDDESGDEEDDGGQYMLSLLDNLDSKGKGSDKNADGALSVAQMAKMKESEFSSSISKKGLTLDNLMEGLQDTQGFKDLQKTFSKQEKATPAPLDRVVADRTQRKIAYGSQSKNISRWTKVVQENRQAETLDFKPKERVNLTRDTLVEKFEPTTDFEKELEEALEEAGQQDEEAVLKAEEKALQDDLGANRLTMEEYKQRRGQLAQVRALMFYHEMKRHHIKKIKSKKYRKIRKKQRERLKESALESAIQEDEELANELKEKEEVERIQERMTLAHKNTSKWAKRILKRGKNVDMETRRALSAQLKRGDDLRRKMMGDEDDSENDSDEDLVETARKVLADTNEENDPTQGKTGLFKLSFMQKGIQKQRDRAREEARRLLTELESNEMEGSGESPEDTDTPEELPKKESMATEKEMKTVLEKGELVATALEFGNSNTISTSSGINIDISNKGSDGVRNDIKVQSNETSGYSSTIKVTDSASTTGKSKTDRPEKRLNASQAPSEQTRYKEDEEEKNPWMQSNEAQDGNQVTNSQKKKKTKRGMVDVESAVDLLDSGTKGPSISKKKDGVEEEKDVNVSVKKITSLTQEELVRRAFATPSEKDIDDDFQKEKEEMAAENDPTRRIAEQESKEVAGWGSWTGSGAPPPRPKKLPKKLRAPKKKEEPKRKRKDDGNPNVIINQKRLKKMANKYMLGDVPHPFSSRAEYEQAMIGGVGKEWNVTGSFKNMTRPEIITQSGKIIQPISKRAKVARAPAKF